MIKQKLRELSIARCKFVSAYKGGEFLASNHECSITSVTYNAINGLENIKGNGYMITTKNGVEIIAGFICVVDDSRPDFTITN